MELISDLIEAKILELMAEAEGAAQFQRKQLASELGCAPSQISYVLQTRFRADPSYQVESRRGLGGSVIVRRSSDISQALAQVIGELPESLAISEAEALFEELEALDQHVLKLLKTVSEAVERPQRQSEGELRAQLLRAMLEALEE